MLFFGRNALTFGRGTTCSLTRRLAIMSLPQGLTASKSVGRLRTFGVKNVKDVPLVKVRE